METLFKLVNAFPMPLWLAMMFAPNHRLTERASRSGIIFSIAALNYVMALIQAARGGSPPGEAPGEGSGGVPNLTTLEGVRQGLSTPEGALAGWSHMLALDLFTGAWIYRQCRRLGAPAWVRIPALLFTLMTGPFGLLLFLVWRMLAGKTGEIAPQWLD
ncbi:MAG: DUF4281 domain-containing protein [Chloroflexi bacterium]|nr:DUF4281 domain-containing protein [Chloroflexota bacterium]